MTQTQTKSEPKLTIKSLLERNKTELADDLPRHIPVEAFINSVLTAWVGDPKLRKCHPVGIFRAAREAAQIGLLVNGANGEGWLTGFYDDHHETWVAMFMPGYKGLIKLAYQHERVRAIRASVVHENDRFEIHEGTRNEILHVPALKDRGVVTLAYCIVSLSDGANGVIDENRWMTVDEIEQARAFSENRDGEAWTKWYDPMACKVVTKRALKYCPQSRELEQAMAIEERWDKQVADQKPDNQPSEEAVDRVTMPRTSRASDLIRRLRGDRP